MAKVRQNKLRHGLGGHVHVNQNPVHPDSVVKALILETKETPLTEKSLPLGLKEVKAKWEGVLNAKPTSE